MTLTAQQTVPESELQPTLALELLPRTGRPTPRPRPRTTNGGADVVAIESGRRNQMEAWAARFAQAAVEIVGGDRPVTQLIRWTSPEVFDDLERRTQLIARASGVIPGTRRVAPIRPRVHSVHSCFLGPYVVEAGVHLKYGPRSRAVALRIERRDNRWICTALEWA